ncbi:MAG: hypothetical protein KGZ66_08270, partial [Selenomonadales bacterium]|nr:hypothetical protein [Selenomonadales bacterium]
MLRASCFVAYGIRLTAYREKSVPLSAHRSLLTAHRSELAAGGHSPSDKRQATSPTPIVVQ